MLLPTPKSDAPSNVVAQFVFGSYVDIGNCVYQRVGLKRFRDSRTAPAKATAGLTQTDAIALARSGGRWDVGIGAIASKLNTATLLPPHNKATYVPSIAGHRASVPRYLSGSPKIMIRRVKTPQPSRVLRMAVHVGRGSLVQQDATYNRGAAVIRAVQHLEEQGYTVDLWAVWRNGSNVSGKHRGRYVSIETQLKPAGRLMDIADTAFALCNLAFQRRLCWAVMESHDESSFLCDVGYGNGVNADYPDFDLHMGYMLPGDQWATLDSAYAHISDQLNQQLNTTTTTTTTTPTQKAATL